MKKIAFLVSEENYIKKAAMTSYLLTRPPDTTEKLLIHFIEESAYNSVHRFNVYYNGSGKRLIAMKALGITRNQYRKAFDSLLQTGTIMKMKSSGKGMLCYFRFSATLNTWIKNLVINK